MKLSYPVIGGQNKVTQGYGPSQIDYSRFGLDGHNGIDFYGTLNDPIMAVADGIVSWVDFESGGYGNYVMIQHTEGTTIYAHMNLVTCKKGDVVKAGQVIGHMGSTGNSTGVHLHFGYRPAQFNANNGYRGYIDPAPLLAEKPPVAGNARKMKCVYPGANYRLNPGYNSTVVGKLESGEEIEVTGETKVEAGLKWHAFNRTIKVWVVEKDGFNNQVLEEI